MDDKKAFTGADLVIKGADEGIVQAEFATLNVVDLDGDVTLPGAFGRQRVKLSAWGHDWDSLPVGKGAIAEEDDKAVFDGQFFLETEAGREHFSTVKSLGDLQEWSYGFTIKDALVRGDAQFDKTIDALGLSPSDAAKTRRILKKLSVFEVSPVMRGAGIGTQTTAVKGEREPLDLVDQADVLLKEVQAFIERCQSFAGELEEEGRLLSGAKRERLVRLADLTASVGDEMRELLRKTEQPAPEAVVALFSEARRLIGK